jgi:hypothetical protein
MIRKLSYLSFASLSVMGLVGCGAAKPVQPTSSISTVNLPQSSIKQQSIGNCWLYATVGWIESLALKASNGENSLNLSESYLTYWFFYESLMEDIPTGKIGTGGFFQWGVDLVARHGVMNEGDFIPTEADMPLSAIQRSAEQTINASLASGPLASLRTKILSDEEKSAIIMDELNKAFGVNMASLKPNVIVPSKIKVGVTAEGTPLTLSQVTKRSQYQWQTVSFPSNQWSLSGPNPVTTLGRSPQQETILRRVKAAMNDGHPVLISWYVDFNALKAGEFSITNLLAAGKPGRSGGHITVLEDYVASGVNPETGAAFTTGEGEVSPEDKALALKYGNIDYFMVKNSWGEKPDSSYMRDGTYGYHKIMASYAFGWIPGGPESGGNSNFGIDAFILPPGY